MSRYVYSFEGKDREKRYRGEVVATGVFDAIGRLPDSLTVGDVVRIREIGNTELPLGIIKMEEVEEPVKPDESDTEDEVVMESAVHPQHRVAEYRTKERVYDLAGHREYAIPKNSRVEFIGEVVNRLGRYVKIEYGSDVFYVKPPSLCKVTITQNILCEPKTGCYAEHPKFGMLVLAARVVTEQESDGSEYWLSMDKDDELRTIRISDCSKFFEIVSEEKSDVGYRG